jgi:MFS family permease
MDGTMATLWKHRDFRILWGGETVSELGSQISIVAVSLVAVRSLHATPFQVSVLVASSTAAFLLVGLPAGAWVDRLRRRPVMISTDLGRLVALGSIPVAYEFGGLTMIQLYIVMFLAGILTVFFDVAYQSYLPSLVGGAAVVEGNSKLSVSAQIAGVVGPSLAGVLVQVVGGPLAVAIDSGSFGVSAMAVAAIKTKENQPTPRSHPNLRSEIGEGVRFVFSHPILRAIAITTATSNLFSSTMAAVDIVFLVRVIHLQPGVIGIVFASAGLGGVIGALTASMLANRYWHHCHLTNTVGAPEHELKWGVSLRDGAFFHGAGRDDLQREPSEFPSATLPARTSRKNEREHALRCFGGYADWCPHRRCDWLNVRTTGRIMDRRRRINVLGHMVGIVTHWSNERLRRIVKWTHCVTSPHFATQQRRRVRPTFLGRWEHSELLSESTRRNGFWK